MTVLPFSSSFVFISRTCCSPPLLHPSAQPLQPMRNIFCSSWSEAKISSRGFCSEMSIFFLLLYLLKVFILLGDIIIKAYLHFLRCPAKAKLFYRNDSVSSSSRIVLSTNSVIRGSLSYNSRDNSNPQSVSFGSIPIIVILGLFPIIYRFQSI